MSISPARQAFDALFIKPSQAAQINDAALTDAATRLVQSTGANGNLFPILDRLAAFHDGRQVEDALDGARRQDVALLLGLGLIRLNSRRFFELNVSVDPSKCNGRLVNWAVQDES
jgi:hypothetical protein